MEAFTPKYRTPAKISTPALWFVFYQEQILLVEDTDQPLPSSLNSQDIGITIKRQHYLGLYNNQHCFAGEASHSQPQKADQVFVPLRQAHEQLGDELFELAARAKQILTWDKINQFCSHCNTKLTVKETERAKLCPKCKLLVYPSLTPAIIVLITRGDEILLARSKRFHNPMYSTLAGFIEPGETAEQTVHREVKEEVGLTVKNLRYFGTQSWPFPNNFMIGFIAEYESGAIRIDQSEIEDAKWFNIDVLPTLPGKASIARKLIDQYLNEKLIQKKLHIRPLAVDEKPPWDLLLSADPSRSNINDYLSHSRVTIALIDNEIIGEYVLLQRNKTEFELMNLAVCDKYQQNGIGRKLVQHACNQAKQSSGQTLWVGTGNSSLHQLKLYQRCGFSIDSMQKGYYTAHYPRAIVENGIHCVDRLCLKKKL